MFANRCLRKHKAEMSDIAFSGRTFPLGGFATQEFYCNTCNNVRRRHSFWLNRPNWKKHQKELGERNGLPF